VNNKNYKNPEFSSFDVCKKLLSFKLRNVETKARTNGAKGVRVFDANNDPFVNLEEIDFNEAFKYLKKYFHKKCNWLKI